MGRCDRLSVEGRLYDCARGASSPYTGFTAPTRHEAEFRGCQRTNDVSLKNESGPHLALNRVGAFDAGFGGMLT